MLPTAVVQGGRSAWKGESFALIQEYCECLRAARAGPFFVAFPNLRHALENNIAIKTQARSCTILPNFIGYVAYSQLLSFSKLIVLMLVLSYRIRFLVHNGKDYVPVTVTQDMVGHKLGEFAITRKRFTYKCVSTLFPCCMPTDGAHVVIQGDQEQVDCYTTTSHHYTVFIWALYLFYLSAIS